MRRAALAVMAYIVLALLPLVLAAMWAPTPRGFWIEFGVGLGFVGLAMLGLQFALTARYQRFAAYFGQDTMLQFHRQAALVAFVVILAHAMVLLIAHPPFVAFLDPRTNMPRALALWGVTVLLAAIIATTLWRQQMRIPYDWWRLGHGIMAVFIVVIGLVHVLRVNHYIAAPWKQAIWAGMTGAALLLLLQMRVLKPLRMLRQPYRVISVDAEPGRCWTLTLEAVGHRGMQFTPGQFAWLTLGVSPFSMEQHPFSFGSSALESGRVQFTIKELGDFTAGLGKVEPGTGAFLEGPYGAFTLDDDAKGAVFIVGGIGITPIMSILRTLRDRDDRRPLLLVYANVTEDRIVFREELDGLSQALDLAIVHVLEHPRDAWHGGGREHGRITPAMLDRWLPAPDDARQYLVCGPEPMMDMAERYLLDRGVSLLNIRSERFNIA
jgi:predicted ferric reductase